MWPSLARSLAARPGRLPFLPAENIYKTRKVWPPDMSLMTRQEQLRYEKKYKRRIQLANYRPGWQRGVKLFTFVLISGYLIYSVGFGEYEFHGQEYRPRDELRSGILYLWGVLSPENLRGRSPLAPLPPEPLPAKETTKEQNGKSS